MQPQTPGARYAALWYRYRWSLSKGEIVNSTQLHKCLKGHKQKIKVLGGVKELKIEWELAKKNDDIKKVGRSVCTAMKEWW